MDDKKNQNLTDQNPAPIEETPGEVQPIPTQEETPVEPVVKPENQPEPETEVQPKEEPLSNGDLSQKTTDLEPEPIAEAKPADKPEEPTPAVDSPKEKPGPEDDQPMPAAQEETPKAEPSQESEPKTETESKDDKTDETPEAEADQPTPQPQTDSGPSKWYVVHTYSGHENKVATTLRQRIESEHLEDKILDILVPMQDKIEIRGGKKASVKEKIFPGYILVKMVLDDTTWLAVRTTQGVTSFVGFGNKPTPISDEEVKTIVQFTQVAQPTFKQVFTANDTVKIVDGPFAEFIGKVDSVDEERGKVKVLVSIFGRETPVELDFLQVQKL